MDFGLNEEMQAMKEAARDFTEKEIIPYADKWDEEHFFPVEVVKKMGELGYYGCPIPEKYGGSDVGTIDLPELDVGGQVARFDDLVLRPGRSLGRFGCHVGLPEGI